MQDRSIPDPPSECLAKFTGASVAEFYREGENILASLRADAGLKPHHSVVDVGCGCGRVAVPCTKTLASGSYLGLDVIPLGVDWCRREISSRYPNFQFRVVDIHNPAYNADGKLQVGAAEAAADSKQFDLAVFNSVFTHLIQPDAEAYLAWMKRLLRPRGRLWATWFLFDEPARRAFSVGQLAGFVDHAKDGLYYRDSIGSTVCVGFDEELVMVMFEKAGLRIDVCRKGKWCGRPDAVGEYQDLIVASPQ